MTAHTAKPDVTTNNPHVTRDDDLMNQCASLGIAAFRIKPDGMPSIPPSLAGIESLLAHPILRACAASATKDKPARLADEANLYRIEDPCGNDPLVLLTLTPRSLTCPRLRGMMSDASLDDTQAARILIPFCSTTAGTDRRLVNAIGLLANHCTTHDQKQRLASELGDRLAQSYEETYTLFRIMRYTASDAEPSLLVRTLTEHVRNALPFGWVSVQYRHTTQVVDSLRGMLILAGRVACDRTAFERMSAEIAMTSTADNWTRVLDPGTHPLAKLVGSEVVCEPITYSGQVIGIVLAGNKSGPDRMVASPEMQFVEAVADFLGTFHENIARFAEQKAMSMGTLKALTSAIDAKDPYTRGHSERVAALSHRIALAMGQTEQQAERVRIAGLVHDMGKIGVPEAILCKAGRLTDEEFVAIKKHPEIGYRILKDVPGLQDTLPGVLHHHERFDGRGYPHGLSGESIPLIARIIGLADTFDAMSSNRSYRAALPREKVLAEIERCQGGQFDPKVVEAFRHVDLSEFDGLLKAAAMAAGASVSLAA